MIKAIRVVCFLESRERVEGKNESTVFNLQLNCIHKNSPNSMPEFEKVFGHWLLFKVVVHENKYLPEKKALLTCLFTLMKFSFSADVEVKNAGRPSDFPTKIRSYQQGLHVKVYVLSGVVRPRPATHPHPEILFHGWPFSSA